MLTQNKYPRLGPVLNLFGHVGSIGSAILLFFGIKLLGHQAAAVAVPLAMLATACVYAAWLHVSSTTSPMIPAVFWGLLAVVTFFAGLPPPL